MIFILNILKISNQFEKLYQQERIFFLAFIIVIIYLFIFEKKKKTFYQANTA